MVGDIKVTLNPVESQYQEIASIRGKAPEKVENRHEIGTAFKNNITT